MKRFGNENERQVLPEIVQNVLLGCSLLEYEESRSAKEHHKFQFFDLLVIRKDMPNNVALTIDNYSKNIRTLSQIGPTITGLHMHRANLFVQDIIE